MLAHGDYCDKNNYITKWVDFTNDEKSLCKFVNGVSSTGGGDWEECYELVLHQVSLFEREKIIGPQRKVWNNSKNSKTNTRLHENDNESKVETQLFNSKRSLEVQNVG